MRFILLTLQFQVRLICWFKGSITSLRQEFTHPCCKMLAPPLVVEGVFEVPGKTQTGQNHWMCSDGKQSAITGQVNLKYMTDFSWFMLIHSITYGILLKNLPCYWNIFLSQLPPPKKDIQKRWFHFGCLSATPPKPCQICMGSGPHQRRWVRLLAPPPDEVWFAQPAGWVAENPRNVPTDVPLRGFLGPAGDFLKTPAGVGGWVKKPDESNWKSYLPQFFGWK